MKPDRGNLYADHTAALSEEFFEELVVGKGPFRIERIVSRGQVTAPGEWYDQEASEWVVLLSGSAVLRFEDESEPCVLRPGDWISIPPHCRHRVESTEEGGDTVWLAVHGEGMRTASGLPDS